ncbi:MAG: hypothetical protein IPF58_13785 [Saprospirales bacterium]|nr:hypothetical protein [Saprospirales bacterium]
MPGWQPNTFISINKKPISFIILCRTASALSFNTATDQLIESINYNLTKAFNRILYQTSVNISVDYIFDANFNNRISSMKIFDSDNRFDAIKYTFYYKD